MNVRIIPRLDIKGPNLVKGIHLEGLRVLGKPEDFSERYYRDGADELIYMDVVASLFGRNNLLDIVSRTAEKIFIPLTVGGGVRSLEDIKKLLRAGADKVAINTAAIQRPEFIQEAANRFGSQCIVISIEAKKRKDGTLGDVYEALTDNGRQKTGRDVVEWAQQAVEMGAGELFVTSIDQEGTGQGFDTDLIKKIVEVSPRPVIAGGGAGALSQVAELTKASEVSGISIASLFHYHVVQQMKLDSKKYRQEGNLEFRKQRDGGFMKSRLSPIGIQQLKEGLF